MSNKENIDFVLQGNQSLLNFLTIFNALYMLKDSMNDDEIIEYIENLINIWSNSYSSHFYKRIEAEDKADNMISKELIEYNLKIIKDDALASTKNMLEIFKN